MEANSGAILMAKGGRTHTSSCQGVLVGSDQFYSFFYTRWLGTRAGLTSLHSETALMVEEAGGGSMEEMQVARAEPSERENSAAEIRMTTSFSKRRRLQGVHGYLGVSSPRRWAGGPVER